MLEDNNYDDLGQETGHPTETSFESKGSNDNISSKDDCNELTRKKSRGSKVRRARRKAYRPYYQLSERERIMREERERLRVERLMERMRAKGRVIAPYNTTQFIMADHSDESEELMNLLKDPEETENIVPVTYQDHEEYYYSSPSDEDEFMSKEFLKDYDKEQVRNLEMMSRQMLLKEYMIIMRKNDDLETKLGALTLKEKKKMKEQRARDMLQQMEEELEELRQENRTLIRSNSEIHEMLRKSLKPQPLDDMKDVDQEFPVNDTGYESNQN